MSITQISVSDYCDRIKYQHDLIQSHNSTLKIEVEKLRAERNDLQNQAKKFYESAYFLNVQNHKLAEVNQRLFNILGNAMKMLPEEAQKKLKNEIEEAKKVSVTDLERRIKNTQSKSGDHVESFSMVDLYIDDNAKNEMQQLNNESNEMADVTDIPESNELQDTMKVSSSGSTSRSTSQISTRERIVPLSISKKCDFTHDTHVSALSFSGNGNSLFTAGKGIVKKWNLTEMSDATKSPVDLGCLADSYIRAIRFNLDETMMLVSGESKDINIVDLMTGQTRAMTASADYQYSLVMSPDSKYCYSCFSDGNAGMWDIQSGRLVKRFAGHEGTLSCIGMSADGRVLMTGGLDKTVRFWDIGTATQIGQKNMSGAVLSMVVTPSKYNTVTVGLDSGLISVIDYSDLNQDQNYQLRMHESSVFALAYAPSGNWMASGGRDKWLNLWKAPNGPTLVRTKESESILACDISVNNWIATGSFAKTATIYSVEM